MECWTIQAFWFWFPLLYLSSDTWEKWAFWFSGSSCIPMYWCKRQCNTSLGYYRYSKEMQYGCLSHLEMDKPCQTIWFLLIFFSWSSWSYLTYGVVCCCVSVQEKWRQARRLSDIQISLKLPLKPVAKPLWGGNKSQFVRKDKKLWKVWADQTCHRILSWQNLGSYKKQKVQVQILLCKLLGRGCRANGVHQRRSYFLGVSLIRLKTCL